MKLNKIAFTVLVASLGLIGCQKKEEAPQPDTGVSTAPATTSEAAPPAPAMEPAPAPESSAPAEESAPQQ